MYDPQKTEKKGNWLPNDVVGALECGVNRHMVLCSVAEFESNRTQLYISFYLNCGQGTVRIWSCSIWYMTRLGLCDFDVAVHILSYQRSVRYALRHGEHSNSVSTKFNAWTAHPTSEVNVNQMSNVSKKIMHQNFIFKRLRQSPRNLMHNPCQTESCHRKKSSQIC